MESMNLKIGEKLKSLRTIRTMSLDDVSVLTGVSKPMKAVDVSEKQAVRFRADMPHAYQNLSGSECTVYNTIFYPSR